MKCVLLAGLDEVILEDAFWVWLRRLLLCEMTRSLVVATGCLLLSTCPHLYKLPDRVSMSPVPHTARMASGRWSSVFFPHALTLWVQAKVLGRF